jgi:hypothetical protein
VRTGARQELGAVEREAGGARVQLVAFGFLPGRRRRDQGFDSGSEL